MQDNRSSQPFGSDHPRRPSDPCSDLLFTPSMGLGAVCVSRLLWIPNGGRRGTSDAFLKMRSVDLLALLHPDTGTDAEVRSEAMPWLYVNRWVHAYAKDGGVYLVTKFFSPGTPAPGSRQMTASMFFSREEWRRMCAARTPLAKRLSEGKVVQLGQIL